MRSRTAIAGLLSAACFAQAAWAGGYDTGERDWDFLFQDKPVAMEAGVRAIFPDRILHNIGGTFGPSPDAREAEAFLVIRASYAASFGDSLRCLASLREPWGGHADYGDRWAYAFSAIEQHFSSRDLGLTCALSAALEKGAVSLLGGLSRQEIRYELTQSAGAPGLVNTTDVRDESLAWRMGVTYEIPEYALRASLIYNSAVNYEMAGTFTPFGGAPLAIEGSIDMPQSAELKFQSGVAPGWLAFGSVKWTDWSVADNMPLCLSGLPACVQVSGLVLEWRDSWTATLGAAHKFSDLFSMAGSLTFDQGATRGFTSQTDTWIGTLTAVVAPDEHWRLTIGASAGRMEGGSLSTMLLPGGIPNPVGYTATFGDDWVFALSANAAIRF